MPQKKHTKSQTNKNECLTDATNVFTNSAKREHIQGRSDKYIASPRGVVHGAYRKRNLLSWQLSSNIGQIGLTVMVWPDICKRACPGFLKNGKNQYRLVIRLFWLFFFNMHHQKLVHRVLTKSHRIAPSEPVPKNPKTVLLAAEVIATVSWRSQVVIYIWEGQNGHSLLMRSIWGKKLWIRLRIAGIFSWIWSCVTYFSFQTWKCCKRIF